jgi:hypothetical protein
MESSFCSGPAPAPMSRLEADIGGRSLTGARCSPSLKLLFASAARRCPRRPAPTALKLISKPDRRDQLARHFRRLLTMPPQRKPFFHSRSEFVCIFASFLEPVTTTVNDPTCRAYSCSQRPSARAASTER